MSVSRSLIYSLSSAAVGFVCLLGSSMIVSRLLTPAEMGIFTIAMGLVTVLITLRVFGVSAYLIQAKELNEERIRSVLFLSILVCWSIGLLIALSGGAAARFYAQPLIQPIFWLLAADFLIFPFRLVTIALLQRRMAFRELFFIDSGAAIVGAVVTVTLVAFDSGVIGLAIGRLASAATALALSLLIVPKDCYVRPYFSVKRDVLSFGGIVVLSNFVAQARVAVAPLILGKALGPAGAAQYEKGDAPSQIAWTMIMPSVASVLLPHFASGAREGGKETERFLAAVNLATAVFWPAFASLALLAPSVILLLYGWQWIPAGPVGSALALASFVMLPASFSSPLFLASGKPSYNLVAFGADLATRVVALSIAIPYGLTWIGIAMIAPALVYAVVSTILLHRKLGSEMRAFYAGLRGPALVTATTVTGPLTVIAAYGYQTEDYIAAVLLGGAATLVMWLVGVMIFMRHLLTAIAAAFQSATAKPSDPGQVTPI